MMMASESGDAAAALPSWVEPQLATLTRERFSDPEWLYERKLDGERCLAFCGPAGVTLKSRSKHDITTTFPEIAAALATQRRGDVVVDGGGVGPLRRRADALRAAAATARPRQSAAATA